MKTIAIAALLGAAATAASGPALAQQKLKFAHVYETSEPCHTAAVQKFYAGGKQPDGSAPPWPKDVYDRLQAIK